MIRRWITVNQAAEYLSLHPISVRRLIDRGKIPAAKIGRSVRVDLKKLEHQLAGDTEYE
ncbi:helix-turn-helix domain-containing protein [Candidatus Peregrinibacteria bacterium]|nr:helix-turn-helix domain-containing protein [Candidatus Peregrinibacteria bacterium]